MKEKKALKKNLLTTKNCNLKLALGNKYIGEWASKILGYNPDQEKEYIQSVIKADFAEAGDGDVFRKVKEDLKDHSKSDEEIRNKMDELNEKAKSDFK